MNKRTIICMGMLAMGCLAWQFDVCGMQAMLSFAEMGMMLAVPAVVAPFPVDPELTSVVVAYRNGRLIADEVLPRVPVGKQNFKYRVYKKEDGFTIVDTKVGRTSEPNIVEFGYTEEDSSTIDNALDELVPLADVENAQEGYDPKARAALSVMSLVLLGHEYEVASKVFAASSYGSNNRVQLSGTSQYSHASSNPLKDMMDRLDLMIMRANKIVFGQAVWNKFRQHAAVVKATNGNSGDSGIASREAVAELLEVDKILVGSGWYNTAKKGQAATMARIWGKHIAMLHHTEVADVQGQITFGVTAQFGDRIAGADFDKNKGMRGSYRVRAGESTKPVIMANDLGYFIEDAVA